MIIFIEGPDGSGKTTLIKQLSDLYPSLRVPKAAETIDIWKAILNLGRKATILTDRSPLTELIYRMWDNDTSKFGYSNVLKWLSCGKLVYCNTKTMFQDSINRGEKLVTTKDDAERLERLYDTFVAGLKAEGVKILYYNWQENCLDDVIKFIEEV